MERRVDTEKAFKEINGQNFSKFDETCKPTNPIVSFYFFPIVSKYFKKKKYE